MKKLLIIIAAVIVIAAAVSGKVKRRQLSLLTTPPESETIADGNMEFVYDYSYYMDTTDMIDENLASEKMLLQISRGGVSKFSSLTNLTIDSILLRSSDEQIMAAASAGKLKYGDFMTIYKNYPEGKLTHTEKICQDWLRYEEDMPQFGWELTDTTASVLGYTCQGAKCKFRGREWTVLFTEDIPIMDGPWKFHGLPGLIMKARDDKGEYAFECVGIKSVADRPITMYKVPFTVTDRKRYYDTRHRYEVNPFAYCEATTNVHVNVTDEAGNPSLDAYDPIELSFDYIERDWKR